MPPVKPMLAKAAKSLPAGEWCYEPKWDGFRCIVFRDGHQVELGSRNEKPLTRYFPELCESLKEALPRRCVVDGEIVLVTDEGLDFDRLGQRIHPAASRIELLSEQTPADFVAFDLLATDDADLRQVPFSDRRSSLVTSVEQHSRVHVTPLTVDPMVARAWFERFEGAGLDGIVAKAPGSVYSEDKRTMIKVKHERTGDFVVAGFRWYKGAAGEAVGSLMLGVWDDGALYPVGVIGSFPMATRRELVTTLAPYLHSGPPGDHPWGAWADAPGATGNRWNASKDMGFVPLRPELVVEAAFEHLQGHRLRHGARFRRWRPDKAPEQCGLDNLEVATPALLSAVFDQVAPPVMGDPDPRPLDSPGESGAGG